MTYDLSDNEKYFECPVEGVCTLPQQVDFYMGLYKKAGILANVGYEIGTPAYPDITHDPEHQLPLTKAALAELISVTQPKVLSGFFWDVYKMANSDQATATDTAQAICSIILPGNSRCSGEIPSLPARYNVTKNIRRH